MPARYAIYYLPEAHSPLALQGASLLGRDVFTGQKYDTNHAIQGLLRGGFAPQSTPKHTFLHSLTAEARRYGLHATLKAPFYLAKGHSEETLIDAFIAFASTQKALALPSFELNRIGNFLALTLRESDNGQRQKKYHAHALADLCVTEFDHFRAPATEKELARRRQKNLSPRQEEYLCRYGYPYVLEDFRFHVTLCHLSEDKSINDSLQKALGTYMKPCLEGQMLSALCLCRSDGDGTFRLLRAAPLTNT